MSARMSACPPIVVFHSRKCVMSQQEKHIQVLLITLIMAELHVCVPVGLTCLTGMAYWNA